MMVVMQNKKELCEFTFVVAITVILFRKRNLNKTYTHIKLKKRTNDNGDYCIQYISVKTLIKY